MKKQYIAALIAVLISVAAFFGGMQYQKAKTPNQRGQSFAQNGQGGTMRGQFDGGTGRLGGQNGAAFRPVTGQIISQDDKSITVKLTDGSSKIILMSSSTPVSKTLAGALTDLKVGETVRVIGTANSDGSVTAQDIQLNPQVPNSGQNPSPTPTQ
jgi:hypothetical protein